MSHFAHRCVMVSFALVFAGTAQSCWLLPVDPAPTLDVLESPALLSRARGTVVVTECQRHLLVVNLPGGHIETIETQGTALAASGIDEFGRVVYVRQDQTWIFSDATFKLVLKSLVTGEERVLGELGHGDPDRPYLFDVGLAAGRAMCTFKDRTPRVYEIETANELALPWWQRRHATILMSGDGRSMICEDILAYPAGPGWNPERLISIDLATQVATRIDDAWPFAFDPDGKLVRTVGPGDSWFFSRGVAPAQAALPGCMRLPCTFTDDQLAIYEGLASPASHPRNSWGLMYPSFERSIRLADPATSETMTLVPRFNHGSYAYSRNSMPARSSP